MGVSKVGERYGISIGLPKDLGNGKTTDWNIFPDSAIPSFIIEIPINCLPRGRARLVGKSSEVGNPCSGMYGQMIIQGVDDYQSTSEIPLYVTDAVRTELSQDVSAIDIEFMVGTPKMHEVMEPLAVDGTSVEAMNKLLVTAEVEFLNRCAAMSKPNSISDNMTWRFVGGNLSDHMENVVEHASIPGDILYWCYNDHTLKLEIGTFKMSKAAKHKNFFMYTNDAIVPTSGARKRVKGSDCDVWYYAGYSPSDLSGNYRDARSPNMIIDSTASGSSKDTGVCSKECWTAILDTMGASDDYKETGAYGKQYVVKPFPSNTHKTYAIAPFVRNYMLAEYSKMVRLNIYNHPGPEIGSCVYFYAASAQLRNGDFLPDENYTARYIVVSKRIYKDATTSTGLLGDTADTTTSDIITEITMVSNCGYAGALGADFKAVLVLGESITKSLEKEAKK